MTRELVLIGVLACGNLLASTGIEVLGETQPQRVFGGENRRVTVQFHNRTAETVRSDIRTRLYQAAGTVAAPFDEAPWKRLEVLAGQTVVESVRLDFPQTRGETLFLVQWIGDADLVVGVSEVLVYPTNLLGQLRPLTAGEPLGVIDPENRIKPALSEAGVEYLDLSPAGLEHCHLIIVAPAQSNPAAAARLSVETKSAAEKGAGVIWIQAMTGSRSGISTPTLIFPQGKGAVAVVSAETIRALRENPVAQLHLVGVAQMTARPEFWMAVPPWN